MKKLWNRWGIYLTISENGEVLREECVSSSPFRWLEELTVEVNTWHLGMTSGFKLDYVVRRVEG